MEDEDHVYDSNEDEYESSSDDLNELEDSNTKVDGGYDARSMVKTFQHLQEAFAGFAKFVDSKGKASQYGVQTCAGMSTRSVRGRGRGRATSTRSTSERAGSRFNSKYFGEIIAQLDDRKKDIVRDHGFGILL
ncbi:uncharacterized protein [Miscanthus floridulus]